MGAVVGNVGGFCLLLFVHGYMVKLTLGGNMLNTDFGGKYIQVWAIII